MTTPYFAFLVLAAAYGVVVVVTNLAGWWRRPVVCAAAAVGIGAILAWRYETAGAGLAAEGAQHWFTIGCLIFETTFIAEIWVFPLLCSRWLDRTPQADREEAALRGMTLDACARRWQPRMDQRTLRAGRRPLHRPLGSHRPKGRQSQLWVGAHQGTVRRGVR
jgi:hypothetical protein